MGQLVKEFLSSKEFCRKSRKISADWQSRKNNIILSFISYAEFKNINRLKDIDETVYSAYINRLHRQGLSEITINRYKKIIKKNLLSHFQQEKTLH